MAKKEVIPVEEVKQEQVAVETVEMVEVGETVATEEGSAHAEKAAQVAKNYNVNMVWCTKDGVFWATSEEKKDKLPKNRGGIEEYSF